MKGTQTLFSSASEEWETPQEFYDELNAEFGFTLDPCATDENHKCKNYFTRDQDGLKMDWGGGAKSILQPAVWEKIKRMGCEVLQRGTQRQHISCNANTGADRYKMVSRLHTAPGGGSFYTRTFKIWRSDGKRAVSEYACYLPCAGNVKEKQRQQLEKLER